ncbi:MAG: tetratricopeptide repeat-containing sulfotransferase family protein [Pseudomonadales bacterium]
MAKGRKLKGKKRFESRWVTIRIDDSGPERNMTVGQALEYARALYSRNQYKSAAKLASTIASKVPKYTYPLNLAADCYLILEQLDAAKRAIDAALAIDKTDWATLRAQASLYRQMDRYEDAINVLQKAIKIHPRNSVLYENYATLYVELGEYDQAIRYYKAALKNNPKSAIAMRLKTDIPGGALTPREVNLANKLLESGELPAEQGRDAHFALAQTYEVSGDLELQMQHLHAANKLQRSLLDYHSDRELKSLDYIRNTFTPQLYIDNPSKAQARGEGLIFIVGMPRCGSSLAEQILSNHPLVSAAGESNGLTLALREVVPNTSLTAVSEVLAGSTAAKLDRLADIYLKITEPFRNSEFMTDKTLGNYYFLGLIPLVFPGAKIVHTFRHPIDNCLGCYRRLFNGTAWSFTYDLEELAIAYESYQAMMRHWHTMIPSKIFDLEYEALVTDQETVTRALLNYCDLAWDEQCLDFTSNTRAVRTNSAAQVRGQLNTDAVARWETYREHLQPLLRLKPFRPGEINGQSSA